MVDKIVKTDLKDTNKDMFNSIEINRYREKRNTVTKNKPSKPLPQKPKNVRKFEIPGLKHGNKDKPRSTILQDELSGNKPQSTYVHEPFRNPNPIFPPKQVNHKKKL